ncbi:MAG: hypothetical protein IPN18_14880 [Ignavibacteriales bacterium]|nr:hypothetical protein [Ignavibacteriales bacterium]
MKNLRFFSFIFAAILLGFTLQAQPVVTITSPANASTSASLTPTLDWTVAGGTGPYSSTVNIYSDAGLTNLVHSQNVGAAVSYAVPSYSHFNTRYYWKVVAEDAFLHRVHLQHLHLRLCSPLLFWQPPLMPTFPLR